MLLDIEERERAVADFDLVLLLRLVFLSIPLLVAPAMLLFAAPNPVPAVWDERLLHPSAALESSDVVAVGAKSLLEVERADNARGSLPLLLLLLLLLLPPPLLLPKAFAVVAVDTAAVVFAVKAVFVDEQAEAWLLPVGVVDAPGFGAVHAAITLR